jgi:hypothetical protein
VWIDLAKAKRRLAGKKKAVRGAVHHNAKNIFQI